MKEAENELGADIVSAQVAFSKVGKSPVFVGKSLKKVFEKIVKNFLAHFFWAKAHF